MHSIQYLAGLGDEVINQIGLSLLSEMAKETATGRMLVETSSLMLAARLAHNYADGSLIELDASNPHRLDNARLRRVLT